MDADGSSNYGKIATGIGEIQNHGLKVSLIDINKSGYLFEPDIENHAILYGMKAANGLNGDIINEIIENRPYTSLQDFMDKTSCNKTVMISLIKSGAFDAFGERKAIMEEYIWSICGAKKRLTMQNFNALVENNIIPQELNLQKRLFVFNKSLKKNCKLNENFYSMNSNYYDFYEQFFDIDILESWDRGLAIQQSVWKKLYDENMIPAKQYLKEHNQELLEKLNQALFAAEWGKYAEGNYSSWEIDSVGFYYHPHELIDVDYPTYGICEFDTLSKDGDIDYYFKKENKRIPIYKTTKICGTVIAKDDMKSSISLLTPRSGVVNIKMTREYYARLNQQLSQIGRDGKKHVAETSWFKKGTLLVINGYRQGNQFRAKKYKKDKTHQVYRIYEVSENGKQILMTHLRWGEQE